MKTIYALTAACGLVLSACQTTGNLKTETANLSRAAVGDSLGLGVSNVSFQATLTSIGNNSNQFSQSFGKNSAWDQAFDAVTLAAGIFGAYTTAYTNSTDLKDAGFIAATVLALKTQVAPLTKADAARLAARRTRCVYDEGLVFAGDFRLAGSTTAAGDFETELSSFRTNLQTANTGKKDKILEPSRRLNNLNKSSFDDLSYDVAILLEEAAHVSAINYAVQMERIEQSNSYATELLNTLEPAVNSLIQTEYEIHSRRDHIVRSTYNKINEARISSIRKDAVSYDSILQDYASALETKNEQEETAQLAEDTDQQIKGANLGAANAVDPALLKTPYTDAAVKVRACALLTQ